jgi:hypothetical protein
MKPSPFQSPGGKPLPGQMLSKNIFQRPTAPRVGPVIPGNAPGYKPGYQQPKQPCK